MSKVMRALGCAFLAAISVGAVSADEIKNWTAPPYWIPETVGKDAPEILLEGDLGVEPMGALPSPPLPLTAMNPCRIVDTRNAPGPFGGPALVANATRTFSIPSGPCAGIPSDASAYSLNFTVIGGSGVFTNAFLTAWPTGDSQPTVSTLNFNANQLEANAAVVPAGTSGSINVFVNAPAHLLIDINGYYRGGVVTSINGQTGNVTLTSVGSIIIDPDPDGLFIDVNGGESRLLPAGSADQTLRHDGTSWVASSVLTNSGSGIQVTGGFGQYPRVAFGSGVLSFLTDPGNDSTLLGLNTFTTGANNTYLGSGAGGVGSGSGNIAIGRLALSGLTTGTGNIGIGNSVGTAVTTGSNNIYIGNPGSGNESGQIRIGTGANITQGTVIVGIYGFGSSGGIPVIVNSGGRLGTTTSSARFKEDVRNIGTESDGLMKLRPVAFRYKESHEPGGLQQYGLIAEEVAEVYPELVVNDDEGRPQAIRSQLLDPLLLNEIQKQRREIEDLKARLEKLEGKNAP
jgi:Chaperone of endosialidase